MINATGPWRETVTSAVERAKRDRARLTIVGAVPYEMHGDAHLVPGHIPLQREIDREAALLVREAVALVPRDVPVTTMMRRGRFARVLRQELRNGSHHVAYARRLRGPGWLHSMLLSRTAAEAELVAIDRV